MDATLNLKSQTRLEAGMDTLSRNYYDDGFGNVTICTDVMAQFAAIAYFFTVDFE